uniref:Uncharacterized protein n=1 Tax=uncultured bacterium contig00063 TaxID=1181546 RepID=A0A806JYY7_9BACT|nr:hypothetical protein [uncultured bacterium contig00063]
MMFGVFLEWRRDRRANRAGNAGIAGIADGKVSLIIPIHNESRRMGGCCERFLIRIIPRKLSLSMIVQTMKVPPCLPDSRKTRPDAAWIIAG